MPRGSIICGASDSIQHAVDSAEPGSTIIVSPGIYRETVWIDKPITLIGQPGAQIRGDNEQGEVERNHWIMGVEGADDVTIDGFTMRYARNGPSSGGISNMGQDNWTIRNCRMSHADGAIVSLHSAENLSLTNCEISDGGQLGVHIGSDGSARPSNVLVRNCVIRNNNRLDFDQYWEAGGIKATLADDVIVEGNDIHGNAGPGIWFDIGCTGATVRNNRVHDNSRMGIYWEVSGGWPRSRIHHNACWANGGLQGWAMDAGIVVHNGTHVDIFENVVAWNGNGITVLQSDRPDHPAYQDVSRVRVSENTIIIDGSIGEFPTALWWAETNDSRNSMFSDSFNRGWQNRYHFTNSDLVGDAFHWGNVAYGWGELPSFSETRGEHQGLYLDPEEVERILLLAGIPASNEAEVHAGRSANARPPGYHQSSAGIRDRPRVRLHEIPCEEIDR